VRVCVHAATSDIVSLVLTTLWPYCCRASLTMNPVAMASTPLESFTEATRLVFAYLDMLKQVPQPWFVLSVAPRTRLHCRCMHLLQQSAGDLREQWLLMRHMSEISFLYPQPSEADDTASSLSQLLQVGVFVEPLCCSAVPLSISQRLRPPKHHSIAVLLACWMLLLGLLTVHTTPVLLSRYAGG
jgi:hypothetical protein